MKTAFPILACLVGLAACSPPEGPPPPAAAPPADGKTSSIGPDGIITLLPGRTLTISGGLEGPPTFVSEGPAEPNPFSQLSEIKGEVVLKAPKIGDIPPNGQSRFTVWVAENGYTTIRVQNGHHRPMVYVTLLDYIENGEIQPTPTATCAVDPRSGALEDRGKPVSAVRIVGMIAVPDEDLCYDPETEKTYKVGAR